MPSSDSPSGGTGQAPAKDQSEGALTVEAVKSIITEAQAGSNDPVSTAIQIFNNLGDNVSVSGEVLRQALSESNVPIGGPLSPLIGASQSVAKSGSQVTVTNSHEVKANISGTDIKFSPVVSFTVGMPGGLPTIDNIQGAAVHKIFWIGITQIQLRENNGQKILHVVTTAATRDFPLS